MQYFRWSQDDSKVWGEEAELKRGWHAKYAGVSPSMYYIFIEYD